MIFNTWAFGVFFLIALALYWLVVPANIRQFALIVLGCIFYAYAFPPYLLLITALGAITFGVATIFVATDADRARRRRWLTIVGVAASVVTLVIFKYLGLILGSIAAIAPIHIQVPALLIPLAISFFTFEFVHFLVDVSNGKITDVRLLPFAVFTMFFPTLVAGPIKRYQHFVPQLTSITPPSALVFVANVYRVLLGLAKKAIVPIL